MKITDQPDSCEIGKIDAIDIDKYEGVETILKALSNKISLAILAAIIKHGEACACELEPALNMAQPLVTTYLRKLYIAGILKKREQWRYTYYSVNEEFMKTVSGMPFFSLLKEQ